VVDETESGLLRQAEDLLRTETPDPARLSALAESLSAAGTCPDGRIDFLPPLARVGKRLLAAGEPRPARDVRVRLRALAARWADRLLAEQGPQAAQAELLARVLKGVDEHGRARRLLERLHERNPGDVRIAQQLSLCTYQDEELPVDARFAKALAVLERIGLRDPECRDPETLGLGGAVYKRRWERNGRIEDLHASLHFYRKGWTANAAADMGYCGVNAAYILDVLAFRERTTAARAGIAAPQADEFDRQARQLREEMQRELPRLAHAAATNAQEAGRPDDDPTRQYRYLVTMAEVAFGLGDWDAASQWLARARQAGHDEWELQTTAKQLLAIARMRKLLPPADDLAAEAWPPPWRALHALLGDDAAAAFQSYRGKVGLALSGGGFRASLFHLGVLARLAECDALRSVEVLSTVSGGSIVGAHYYLALRHLLQTRSDGELARDDYVTLVTEVIGQFVTGIQKNLRVRALASLAANIRMLLGLSYGRSNRMGELYEDHLYSRVPDGHRKGEPRSLPRLLIHPPLHRADTGAADGLDKAFKPRYSNWRRRAKVPILLLNATSLNSGHNWHFTASWMGEPPGLLGQEVDVNERYRCLGYAQAPTEELRHFRLGYAVAASAGVPALFDPLTLRDLYPGRTVRLVDGGVHDNQGVAGLLDEGCTLILCSDASGQMDDQDSPASHALGVFMRSDGILQDRVREAQYQDLAARESSHALQGLFFIHLKAELDTDPIDWVDCREPSAPTSRPSCTTYGVDRKIQRQLSAVRTDLDTFTEIESYALMASGYLMTDRRLRDLDADHRSAGLPGGWAGYDVHAPRRNVWPFHPLLSVLAADPDGSDRRASDLAKQLGASRSLFFKVWMLVPWLRNTAIGIAVAALVGIAVWVHDNWDRTFAVDYRFGVGAIVTALGIAVLGLLLPLAKALRPVALLRKWLATAGAATAGCLLAHVQLICLDPLFRRRGALARLLKLPGK